jgi:hypothetical protein
MNTAILLGYGYCLAAGLIAGVVIAVALYHSVV